MRCFLREIKKNWHASFDFGGVSYTHSLRTRDEKEAERRIGPIRDVLYRLEHGTLEMPSTADPKAFIVSGGRVEQKPRPVAQLTMEALKDAYLASRSGVEENTRGTLAIHLGHACRVFGPGAAVESIRLADVQGYARARTVSGYTIRKELRTFRQACQWAFAGGLTKAGPSWMMSAVDLPKDRGREPFRTFDEIERILARGGASEEDQARRWECLYLRSEEVSELLDFVQGSKAAPFVYPMAVFVALTGCRRSEMTRSLIDDWDLGRRQVMIREKKRDTSKTFTLRRVDLHPRLLQVMTSWFEAHPGGRHAISLDGQALTGHKATDHLNRVLGTHAKWSKVPGFHTLRHSLASILASKGTDQRYIDKILGHSTEQMRRRYQHLLPRGVKDAIEGLL